MDHVLKSIDEVKLTSILRNLIKMPCYVGEEKERAEYMMSVLERLGMDVSEVFSAPRRPNVVASWVGKGGGKKVIFSAHLDNHWYGSAAASSKDEVELHSARMDGDRIYGVGTDDNLTPMACYVAMVDAMKRSKVDLKGEIIIVLSVGESEDCIGARTIVENGIRADMAIVGEPTNTDIGIAGAGRVEVEIRTRGSAPIERTSAFAERHGFRVVNAVLSMTRILDHILKAQEREGYFHQTHPLIEGEGAELYIGPIIGGGYDWGCLRRVKEHKVIGELNPESLTLHSVPTCAV